MNSIIGIIKAWGFEPMPTAIIIALLTALFFLLKAFYKNVIKQFDRVITTRTTEIAVVKATLETLTSEIEEVKNKIDKNNETTTLLAYHQCMNEAMSWKSKGEISVGAKMHFDKVWEAYLTLGDGHGDDPKRIIDKLPIVN